jgi:uncharacterized protein YfaS (alpha-2-macroglobulin family)
MHTRGKRSIKSRLGVLASLLLVIAAFGGCGSDGPIGAGDHGDNDAVSIDEARITGPVHGKTIHVSIPVHAKAGSRATGSLRVAITAVDETSELSSASVAYDVPAGADGTANVDLPLPGKVAHQEDLVRYNLRIDDGTSDGIRIRRSLLAVVPAYEIQLEGPSSVSKAKQGAWRVRLRDAFTKRPLADQAVTLTLKKGDADVSTLDGKTSATGDATFDLSVPATGSYTLVATVAAQGTSNTTGGSVSVNEPGGKVLLTTDKPIYKPGQLVHIRALSLAEGANTPVAGAPILFEMQDGKGNKIMKRSGSTDAWGIASTDMQLGNVLNEGTFKVKVTAGSASSEKTVNVAPYALPKFKAAVTTDQPYYLAGKTLTGVVQADYFFGKPVATSDVKVEASTLDVGQTVFQTVQGKTDATGRFQFQVKLPASLTGLPLEGGNAAVTLHVTITDTAGQQVEKTSLVIVAKSGVAVSVVPESTTIVPGVDNQLDVFVNDPLGAPLAQAAVSLASPGDTPLTGTTDEFGHVALVYHAGMSAAGGYGFTATVTPQGGSPVTQPFTFGEQSGDVHLSVRTDRAVYGTGDTVNVNIVTSGSPAHVYVDWLNDGQTVDMRTLDVASGSASFSTSIDTGLLGTNRIEAYVVDSGGNIVRAGRTLFARKAGGLSVGVTTDKPVYAPGENAKMTFSVKDEQGNPTVAALGVQVVDEAVFALVDAQPGLLRTYFELDGAFAKPQYEIQGPPADFSSLLFNDTADADPTKAAAAQTKAKAALAALGDRTPTGLSASSWPGVLAKVTTTLAPYYQAARAQMLPHIAQIAADADKEVRRLGCDPNQYWCDATSTSYGQEVYRRIVERVEAWDFWGNRWHLPDANGYWAGSLHMTSDGPDEKPGTGDDGAIDFSSTDLGLPDLYPPWSDGEGGSGGAGVITSTGTGNAGGASGGSEPRVRKDFPETLYVNPALITGPDGTATVDVGMADSITEWRVSSLANSASGKLGSGVAGVKVFKDFFVDISFPASLTRGDTVEFPIAVYNYLANPQSVVLTLQPGTWYTPLGSTTMTVDLAPGQVTGVRFPVSVDQVGLRTLVVTAKGTQAQDAVARQVRVVPDGKPVVEAHSGAVAPGAVTQTIVFPPEAVPGSPALHVDVFPAFLSSVVKGMDSMLQVPSGCFEQTTSTTWPNVLVTRYMTQTGQVTPDLQMKADSLISAGYQRLLTFEHKTGGYSWFGDQDPAPNVSVTAFGVMEFADMAKVATVDEAMLARTVQWLASQQSPDGSWQGETTEFFSFQTSAVRNTAFTVWALSSAGYQQSGLSNGMTYMQTHLGASPDAYTLALVANAAVAVAPNDAFTAQVLQQLDDTKTVAGEKITWSTAGTQTNFYGSGLDSDVAATALAAHAMMQAGAYPNTVQGALAYLVGSRDQWGNFGSTQATIWTLKALLLAASKGTQGAVGDLAVELDGAPFTTVSLTAAQADVMTTVDLGALATVGSHDLKLTFVGTGKPSYNIVAGWNVPWANISDPPGPLGIDVAYDKTTLALDETVNVTVTLTNNTGATEHMILATIGIPPGFAVEAGDFADDLAAGRISKFETTERQLVLYVPALGALASTQIQYRLRATMPVTADDGGSEVHPYYEPQAKTHAASRKLTVTGS